MFSLLTSFPLVLPLPGIPFPSDIHIPYFPQLLQAFAHKSLSDAYPTIFKSITHHASHIPAVLFSFSFSMYCNHSLLLMRREYKLQEGIDLHLIFSNVIFLPRTLLGTQHMLN